MEKVAYVRITKDKDGNPVFDSTPGVEATHYTTGDDQYHPVESRKVVTHFSRDGGANLYPVESVKPLADTELAGRIPVPGKMPSVVRKLKLAALSPDQKAPARARYEKDLAEFKALQAKSLIPLNFENWQEEKYGKTTGKKGSGAIVKAARLVNDILAGRPEEVGGSRLGNMIPLNPIAGAGRVLSKVREGMADITDDDANFSRYINITTPKTESPSFAETWKSVKERPGEFLGNVAEGAITGMLDPQELPTNLAGAALGAGIGAAGARAAQAVRAGQSASALQKLMAMRGATPALSIGSDAALGGASSAFQSGEYSGSDFLMGAAPGAVLGAGSGLVGNVVGKATGKIAERSQGSKFTSHAKAKEAANRKQASFLAGQLGDASHPDVIAASQAPLTASDVLAGLGNKTKSKDFQARVSAAAQEPEVRALVPWMTDEQALDPDSFLEALRGKAKAEAEMSAPAPAVDPKTAAKLAKAQQDLPTSLGNEDLFFSSGNKKEQAERLLKAARSYRLLREHGAIPENPRFEGKTDADVIAEQIKKLNDETAQANEMKTKTQEQEALKKELIDENNATAAMLQSELDRTMRHTALGGQLTSAWKREKLLGDAGALRKKFASLSPEEQRHFILNADDMGDAGAALKEGLGVAYQHIHDDLATNTALSDKEFGAEVKDWLAADAKRTERMVGVQAGQRDAAMGTQAELDPIYEATGIKKPELGRNPPKKEEGWVTGDEPVPSAPEPQNGVDAAREAHVGQLARTYVGRDEPGRVALLAAELEARPELAQDIGIEPEILDGIRSQNSEVKKDAKKVLDAKLTDVVKQNQELPQSFR